MKKKLVYISSIAAPHQIKLCYELQSYFETEFWFYDSLGERASWWKVELGSSCKIIPNVKLKSLSKFYTTTHINWLNRFQPDVVILGGFSIPANYLAYRWAKRNNKKVVVFTERSRNRNGGLRKRSLIWMILHFLYKNVDMVMVSAKDIIPQFRDEFKFGKKVVESRYAADIDNHLKHSVRVKKKHYTYLFANRLTEIYNPILAIEIFNKINQIQPNSGLVLNAIGPLRINCEELIENLEIKNQVEFLDHIESWESLHTVYQKADILLLPATFSNGNFTILEAMASGMGIVISNKILGVGKLIKNTVNGFAVPVDSEFFVQSILEYINNPNLLKTHAEKNREIVSKLNPAGTAKMYWQQILPLLEN